VNHTPDAPLVNRIMRVTSSLVVMVMTRGAGTEEEDQIRCAGQAVRSTDQ
jgi:hypothetical protein